MAKKSPFPNGPEAAMRWRRINNLTSKLEPIKVRLEEILAEINEVDVLERWIGGALTMGFADVPDQAERFLKVLDLAIERAEKQVAETLEYLVKKAQS